MSEPPTAQLFRDDAFLKTCTSTVVGINERGGIILDRSIFYASSGGQPGDTGTMQLASGEMITIGATVYQDGKTTIVHVPAAADSALPAPGEQVTLNLDWDKRHLYMRIHSCLHLMCALVDFPVTGGQIGAGTGRLDFAIEDAGAIDKQDLTTRLNELISANHAITDHWITDDEMAANPDMIRTMSVKPPMGQGRVRIVDIGEGGGVDSQPCGGTHVAATGEIGAVEVPKIEKKGRQNRRVRLKLL